MGQIPRINDPGIDNAVQREPVQKPQNVTKVNGPILTPPPPTISHGQLTGRRMVPQLTRGGASLGSSGHISCLVGFGACYDLNINISCLFVETRTASSSVCRNVSFYFRFIRR